MCGENVISDFGVSAVDIENVCAAAGDAANTLADFFPASAASDSSNTSAYCAATFWSLNTSTWLELT